MKRIHMKYVIVTGVLLCLSAIYYYVAARMLLESEVIAIPVATQVERSGVPLPTAVTATSTWEQMMTAVAGGCGTGSSTEAYGIATAGVPLQGSDEVSPEILSFRFTQCEKSPVSFGAEGNRIYKMVSGTTEQVTIAQYWQLSEGQTAEEFIAGLTQTLPTELERTWCVVKAKQVAPPDPWQQLFVPDETVHQVLLDKDYYNTPDMDIANATSLCAPYGDGYGVSFFKQIGRYLFLIPVGQTMPTFSPASFEVR